ncbi:MAG: fatty acid CoA ligase family protein [Planctomycetaceae bacterium]
MPGPANIADRLRESARLDPDQIAVACPNGRDAFGKVVYAEQTFAELDAESDRLAVGLAALGVRPGTRLVLAVPPGLEFIALTFAIFRSGAVAVLVDPGMGRSNIFRCLQTVEPDGFVAVPAVQAVRALNCFRFPQAKLNVTVNGRRWFWGGATYASLQQHAAGSYSPVEIQGTDPAAIIFTSGSTGPPKGVVYEHAMFDAQVDLLRDYYSIQPGEVDLPGFPLFALFNAAMRVTTIIPDMNPAKPAQVDPARILEAIRDRNVTQAFGSPAIWNRIGRHCEQTGETLSSLRRVLSAGAPVPVHVIRRIRAAFEHADADIFTPYGATESLPVASNSGRIILEETAARSAAGEGTCVGSLFPQVRLRIIRIEAGPIKTLTQTQELPPGETGEILVQAPVTTREYFLRPDATALAKISDPDGGFWHRMGDVGWLDEQQRLWFCGRKAHIVETAAGRMFTIPCESIFNEHPQISRSALVGTGTAPNQQPVLIAEPESGAWPDTAADRQSLRAELFLLGQASPLTRSLKTILFHRSLPVDIRHNVKIFREKLSPWAEEQLRLNAADK